MGVDNYIYSPKHMVCTFLGRHYRMNLDRPDGEELRPYALQPYTKQALTQFLNKNIDWINKTVFESDGEDPIADKYPHVVALKFMEKYPDSNYYLLPDCIMNFNYDSYADVDPDSILSGDDFWANNHGPHRGLIQQGGDLKKLKCIDCGKEFEYAG